MRVDPAIGGQTTLASGGFPSEPAGVAIDSNGDILVADRMASRVVRLNRLSGVRDERVGVSASDGPA